MTVAVIGCGNPNRSDDGVGPAVIARLAGRDLGPDITLYDAGTDGMSVMYRARGATRLIIVDARAPDPGNPQPGAVYDVPGDVLEAVPPHSLNLHDFRWDHAIYAGRQIYGKAFPADVRVFLVEAGSLDLGLELTPLVADVVDRVADMIAELCREPATSAESSNFAGDAGRNDASPGAV